MRQREAGLDQRVDALARIGLGPDGLQDVNGHALTPVRDKLAGVGRPTGEVVVERTGRDAEPLTHLGQLQSAVAEVAQHIQPGIEIRLLRRDSPHPPRNPSSAAVGSLVNDAPEARGRDRTSIENLLNCHGRVV